MNSFKIDDTEFEIGSISFSIENNILNLEISGNEDVFHELTKQDDCQWSWALYPPRIYFHGVPYKENTVLVDNDLLDQYDVSLYMMEHNDFMAVLKITDDGIDISGFVYMDGKKLPLKVSAERKYF